MNRTTEKDALSASETKRLAAAALAARRFAYAPYSGFSVGAAVLSNDGRVFTGCNVENASYGLTVCAERVAVCKAVSDGAVNLRGLAVAADGKGAMVTPCGACRQVMAEFAPKLRVLLIDAGDPKRTEEMPLADLLPRRFQHRRRKTR